MQDSFQNKMSEIIWGSWGRETQPSTATASHDYNQIVLLIILGNGKKSYCSWWKHTFWEDSPAAENWYIWSHEYRTEEKQKAFNEMLA